MWTLWQYVLGWLNNSVLSMLFPVVHLCYVMNQVILCVSIRCRWGNEREMCRITQKICMWLCCPLFSYVYYQVLVDACDLLSHWSWDKTGMILQMTVIKVLPKFVAKGPFKIQPPLVLIMALCQMGDKPLSENIYVTQFPQVKWYPSGLFHCHKGNCTGFEQNWPGRLFTKQ